MKLGRDTITTESVETLHTRVREFMQAAGYRSTSVDSLWFERGSILESWITFTPKGWYVQAAVDIQRSPFADSSRVMIELDVNTTGQIVMPKEQSFWDKELDDFEAAITTGQIDQKSAENEAMSAVKHNIALTIALVAIGITAVVGFCLFVATLISISTD